MSTVTVPDASAEEIDLSAWDMPELGVVGLGIEVYGCAASIVHLDYTDALRVYHFLGDWLVRERIRKGSGA